ncbi:hypothetical protein BDB00DRAFT_930202 [Zychaea mexicana]|uniref:uncharacterized protein n=1 Tax=Zychaea mexicana TaxID=64656 RepID=UPI0022FF3F7C|nr:uncharacterized protein BDB00DRAFT_930202 [Zychaea mexicana]KAI9491797.1 hypothetical protein BDB00DRAFT_930202 [Zychaea mexicana]
MPSPVSPIATTSLQSLTCATYLSRPVPTEQASSPTHDLQKPALGPQKEENHAFKKLQEAVILSKSSLSETNLTFSPKTQYEVTKRFNPEADTVRLALADNIKPQVQLFGNRLIKDYHGVEERHLK